jgi:hypothetical protein
VDDALLGAVEIVKFDIEFATILPQRFNLLSRNDIYDRKVPVNRGNVVVLGGDRQVGSTNRSTGDAQAFECLRAGDFMDQMQIDIKHRLLAGFVVHHVLIPDFFE